jgi:hypothetical protein
MLSRHGLTHNVYPGNHVHDIVSIPFSDIPAEQLPADKMCDFLESEIIKGCNFLKATHTIEDDKVVKERVLKALEPWIAQWIQRSDSNQVQLFLDLAKSRLTTSRTGIVPEVNRIIYTLRNWEKRLHLHRCDIEEVIEIKNGFRVSPKIFGGRDESEIDVSLIVSCLGYNSDFTQTSSPVWRHLLDHGLAIIHPRTCRGVAVGKFGELVRRDGSISERIFAVGPMRQGDEIERNGRLGAFVFSVGTIRNQALLAAVRILWLTENGEYSTMDRFTRCEIDRACEAAFDDGITKKPSKHLVNTILAVCLAKDTSFLVEDHKRAVEKWMNRHLEDTVNYVNAPVSINKNIIHHNIWYIALMKAAFVATDISRLAHDHYRVANYMTCSNTEFIAEKLELSSILRASVAVFGASTASILIYSPDDQKLYPFAMYRRVQSFTPTAYGEGVAGALVKAFYEGEQSTDLDPRLIFRVGPTIVGTYVPNYNQLPQDLKKEVYVGIDRKFPAVLVSLVASQGLVLGVVYVEAEIKKIFNLGATEQYVYDLETENHHFQAGVGSLIVHNTDSIFSCYRFRENTKPVNKIESLKIWKNVIKFARELILPYFGKKEQELFNDIFNKYYNDNMIVDLTLPKGPITIPHSSHNMIILPLEERMKQFITEYMQESYLPWLWTLAELVEKK